VAIWLLIISLKMMTAGKVIKCDFLLRRRLIVAGWDYFEEN